MGERTSWREPAHALDGDAMRALVAGEIPAIHLEGFASPAECEALCRAVHGGTAPGREAATSPMTIYGGNLSNFRGASRAEYFADVERAYRAVDAIHAASFDPLERILEALRRAWHGSVDVAHEEAFGRYFAGCVKSRGQGSALHYDFVPYLLDGYGICDIVEQLSWNLYLEVPAGTGATTVYDAMVRARPPGQGRDFWDNLLPAERVAHARAYTFMPRVGEVVLLNTRCPHSIEVELDDDAERRTQVGSFIGVKPDESLVLWS